MTANHAPRRLKLLREDFGEMVNIDDDTTTADNTILDSIPTLYVNRDAIVVESVTIRHMVGTRGSNPLEAMVLMEISGTTVSRELSTVTLIADSTLATEWATILSNAAEKANEDLLRISNEGNDNEG